MAFGDFRVSLEAAKSEILIIFPFFFQKQDEENHSNLLFRTDFDV